MSQVIFKQEAPFYADGTMYDLPKPDVGFINGVSGKKLRVALWLQTKEKPKGTVFLQPGRTEPIEKYIEGVSDFFKRGFCVAMFDWQGQGLSDRLLRDLKKGHIDCFDSYDANYKDVIEQVYTKHCSKPWLAVGHSMGGCLSLSVAYQNPGYFDAMILSAPMLSIKAPPFLLKMAPFLTRLLCMMGGGALYYSDQNKARLPSDPNFDFTHLSSSKKRFEGFIKTLQEAPHLGVVSPTFRWVSEALKRIYLIQDSWALKTIKVPSLLLSPQEDQLVDPVLNERVFKALPKSKIIQVKGSQHELLMEKDCYRNVFWQAFDSFCCEILRID